MMQPNLLPEKEERSYNFYLYLVGTRKFLFFQAVVLIFMVIFLTGGYMYYSHQLVNSKIISTQMKDEQNSFDSEELQNLVDSQSGDISSITKILKGSPRTSKILDELFLLFPEGVTLDSISIDVEKIGEINIDGRAKSRDQVVLLTERFNNSDFFDVFYAPLSNIEENFDVPFTFILNFDLKNVVFSN